jgi:hypothetical protein
MDKNAGLLYFLTLVEGDGLVHSYERTRGHEKLIAGDAKYGPDSWRSHDHLYEAVNETVDLVNYCYLRWLQLEDQYEVLGPHARQAIEAARTELIAFAREALVIGRGLDRLRLTLAQAGVPASLDGRNLVGL